MKSIIAIIFLLLSTVSIGQGIYAPPVGTVGSTAIHKDSSIFVGWANKCKVVRGLMQINNSSLGFSSQGDSSNAINKADAITVSLGDSGYAIFELDTPAYNGIGHDFVIFENSFSNTFLELAFVEVSSDGINYFRFPAISLTQDTMQVSAFGSVDCTNLYNFAGKYKANYGTPFNLDDIPSNIGLNINKITHIKIIDAIGSINEIIGSNDSRGNKVNDPFPTPFPSGGFDLDALGLINISNTASLEKASVHFKNNIRVFPNPFKDKINVSSNSVIEKIEIYSLTGVLKMESNKKELNLSYLNKGVYFVKVYSENNFIIKKIIKH